MFTVYKVHSQATFLWHSHPILSYAQTVLMKWCEKRGRLAMNFCSEKVCNKGQSLSHTLIKVVATMICCLPNTNHSPFHHLQIRIHLLKSLLCTACTKYKEMLIWQHLYYQIILIYIFIQYYTCITEITALYRTIYFVKSDKPKQKMYTVKSHSSACLDHTEVSVI